MAAEYQQQLQVGSEKQRPDAFFSMSLSWEEE
jgi:hypothetical protein